MKYILSIMMLTAVACAQTFNVSTAPQFRTAIKYIISMKRAITVSLSNVAQSVNNFGLRLW